MRDEFPSVVRRATAERVGLRCSNPACRALTVGPRSEADRSVNLGVAAHISAAAPGGPRYDDSLTSDLRGGADNCIWLCQNCAKLVDNDARKYETAVLRGWKRDAEAQARATLGRALGSDQSDWLSTAEMEILRAAATEGDLWLIKPDGFVWVRSGDVNFHNNDDPAFGAEYVDALERLIRSGLVRHQSELWYTLTSKGFKVARALVEAQA